MHIYTTLRRRSRILKRQNAKSASKIPSELMQVDNRIYSPTNIKRARTTTQQNLLSFPLRQQMNVATQPTVRLLLRQAKF